MGGKLDVWMARPAKTHSHTSTPEALKLTCTITKTYMHIHNTFFYVLSLSFCLSFSLSHIFSLYLSLSFSLSFSVSHTLPHSLSLILNSFSLSLSLSLCLSLSFCLSFSLSVCLYLSVCLSLAVSLYLTEQTQPLPTHALTSSDGVKDEINFHFES